MKGIVFNLLQDVVSTAHGEAAWDLLLDKADLDGAYTSLGSYSDDDIFALVRVASEVLGIPQADVLRWFGRQAMPLLAARFPSFFDTHARARDFLLTLNGMIHPEVRKLYPGAQTPVFDFDTSNAGELVIGYNSPRRLCALAEGFMHGAADYYGEALAIDQSRCMHDGAERCVFHVRAHPA
jgi:hypothetical protein